MAHAVQPRDGADQQRGMELRHLRYFIAVGEAGSLTVAAQQTLHTSQPSLSRQIRDLEDEDEVEESPDESPPPIDRR